jgi:hypothetical protein
MQLETSALAVEGRAKAPQCASVESILVLHKLRKQLLLSPDLCHDRLQSARVTELRCFPRLSCQRLITSPTFRATFSQFPTSRLPVPPWLLLFPLRARSSVLVQSPAVAACSSAAGEPPCLVLSPSSLFGPLSSWAGGPRWWSL